MRRSALILGVSQTTLEGEFFMVDIPFLLEEKAREKRDKLLEQIMIRLATNQRYMPDDQYKEFMNRVIPNDDVETQFDREKFEELRLMTNMGINKSR